MSAKTMTLRNHYLSCRSKSKIRCLTNSENKTRKSEKWSSNIDNMAITF